LFVSSVKEILQELVESLRNNKQNYNAKDEQSKSKVSKDLCRSPRSGIKMFKKLTKYEKLCGASVDKLNRHNYKNGGIFWGVNIFQVVIVDGERQVEADEFWKLAQKRVDLYGSACR
jgi:hypothetical protein